MQTLRAQTFDVNDVAVIIAKQFPELPGMNIELADIFDEMDASIEVTDRISVQVGETYLIVGLWNTAKTAMRNWPSRVNTDLMLKDLREAFLAAGGK